MATAEASSRDDLPAELTVVLPKAIEFAGTTHTEITMREPTAGELVEIDKRKGREADIFAIALLSGVPEGAIRQLPARPFMKFTRHLVALLGEDEPTGEND